MKQITTQILIGLIWAAAVATPAPAIAQDGLAQARALYEAASYEEALTALTRLHESSTNPAVIEQIDQYRAFCLFALGRLADARQIAESLMTNNPTMKLDSADVPPRIASMFAEARARSLPEIVRNHYRAAKAALDKKDYAAAEPELLLVHQALVEAEKISALDDTSAALRDLVDGFLDLVHASRTVTPPAPAPIPVPAPAPAPIVNASAATPAPAPAAKQPIEAPAPVRVFDGTSPTVTAPVIVQQEIPPIPVALIPLIQARMNTDSGLLYIVIDENGDVERASVRVSIQPTYDRLILNATKRWKYQPAMKDGSPVKFEKTIAIAVRK